MPASMLGFLVFNLAACFAAVPVSIDVVFRCDAAYVSRFATAQANALPLDHAMSVTLVACPFVVIIIIVIIIVINVIIISIISIIVIIIIIIIIIINLFIFSAIDSMDPEGLPKIKTKSGVINFDVRLWNIRAAKGDNVETLHKNSAKYKAERASEEAPALSIWKADLDEGHQCESYKLPRYPLGEGRRGCLGDYYYYFILFLFFILFLLAPSVVKIPGVKNKVKNGFWS